MERKANVAHLVAAFDALSSVDPNNFKMMLDNGKPFEIKDGKCNTVCNAVGWIAQHPYFKSTGVEFVERAATSASGRSMTYYTPSLKLPTTTLTGEAALSFLMGVHPFAFRRVFTAYGYAVPEAVPMKDVLRRLKTLITKSGGKEELKALIKANAPPKVKKPKVKKAKKAKAAKKKVKKVKKAVKIPTAK